MKITKGKRARAQKVVIYGTEGIGKSSLASQFPEPLFIDTEGSTDNMDVARLDKPTSWIMLNNQIAFIKANPTVCKTLVIDTIDWAESLCVDNLCAMHGKKGIEDFGYGNGYVYAKEEMGRFLNKLQDLIEIGINVVLTAHAQIRKFELPDEMGSYDKYELKLGKKTSSQTAPLVKEWADLLLFCNYKTYLISQEKSTKKKAQGNQRVMYTEHNPAWDAKNRHGLPSELPLDYVSIAHIFKTEEKEEIKKTVQTEFKDEKKEQLQFEQPKYNGDLEAPKIEKTQEEKIMDNFGDIVKEVENTPVEELVDPFIEKPDYIPQPLWDLMQQDNITEEDIKLVTESKGYFPKGTPMSVYNEQGYLTGYIIPKWEGLKQLLKQIKQ
ncbi:ATP-binding protein [Gemella haemolysans]|uniref:ATP-binding protein n=1 Tax=Gemella haemolysans TaxID=1379 RepID=UPI0023789EDE|nr:ATP-binding protein [Gemella haemolysans]